MARVVLDIPGDQIQAVLKALLRIGIDRCAVSIRRKRKTSSRQKNNFLHSLRKISTSFILFDWEFFSNELEYE